MYVDHYYDYDETKWATINMITLMMTNTIMITTRFPLLDHQGADKYKKN